MRSRKHGIAPTPIRNVEQQCAGCVRDIDRVFACKPQTDVIFRQQESPKAFPQFRFVIADPQELGQGEVSQRRIAGVLDNALLANFGIQLGALGGGSLIAPDQRWTNYLVSFVEKHGAVHLSGKSDAHNLLRCNASVLKCSRDGLATSLPPVFGTLFRPSILRRSKGLMFSRGRTDYCACAVHYHGSGAAGTYVNA